MDECISYPDQTIAEYRQRVEELNADLFAARQAISTQDVEWRAAFEVSESDKMSLNTQVTLLNAEILELKNGNESMHSTLLKYMDFIKVLQNEYERVRHESLECDDASPEAQQARSWRRVVGTLNEVAPEWSDMGSTGADAAVNCIRKIFLGLMV